MIHLMYADDIVIIDTRSDGANNTKILEYFLLKNQFKIPLTKIDKKPNYLFRIKVQKLISPKRSKNKNSSHH